MASVLPNSHEAKIHERRWEIAESCSKQPALARNPFSDVQHIAFTVNGKIKARFINRARNLIALQQMLPHAIFQYLLCTFSQLKRDKFLSIKIAPGALTTHLHTNTEQRTGEKATSNPKDKKVAFVTSTLQDIR